MSNEFPLPDTTTLKEAARLMDKIDLTQFPVLDAITADLDRDVHERPFRIDYCSLAPSPEVLGRTSIITNGNGEEQFRLGLNLAHPFVQAILEWPKHQRDAAEILLLILFGATSGHDDATRLKYEIATQEWGGTLARCTKELQNVLDTTR